MRSRGSTTPTGTCSGRTGEQPCSNEIGWDIAVDSNGDVYVADSRFTVLKYDGAKYDADGNELWTNRSDNGVGDDIPKGLTATADRVYIAGLSRGTGTFYDYVTLALSNS